MSLWDLLPKNIKDLIFQFDPTYHNIHKDNLKFLQKQWSIKYINKDTGSWGWDITCAAAMLHGHPKCDFYESIPYTSYSSLTDRFYYTKNSYYLSSISNLIAVSPPGFINISGFGIFDFFYRELFEELGIKIELFRVGEFKGAAETYVRNEFSEENKKQYYEFLDERFNFYLKDISDSRNLTKTSLINFINNYETELLSDALKNNLVDTLFYSDQFDDYLKTKIDSSYNKVSFLDYKKTVKIKNNYSKDKIAILYALGGILPGKGDEGIFSESIIKEIKKIKKNKNIKSVIFYINSGGGSAFASDLIHREIQLLNEKKPVIVYMSDVCASGGYYIGMPADTLISSKHSILGSIGVFGIVPDLSGLIKNKLKINVDEIKTSQNIGEINLLKPLNKDEKKLVQRGVNQIYDDFLNVVSKGRKMSKEEVNKIARGRVYYGETSKKINLVSSYIGYKLSTFWRSSKILATLLATFSHMRLQTIKKRVRETL